MRLKLELIFLFESIVFNFRELHCGFEIVLFRWGVNVVGVLVILFHSRLQQGRYRENTFESYSVSPLGFLWSGFESRWYLMA